MTTPPIPPVVPVAHDLARLFHRTYERMGPDHGYGQGVNWDGLDEGYRQMLIDVFADMELALRPGRSVTQIHAGQTVILLVGQPDTGVTTLRELVQSWLPDNRVRVITGVTQALVTVPGDIPSDHPTGSPGHHP